MLYDRKEVFYKNDISFLFSQLIKRFWLILWKERLNGQSLYISAYCQKKKKKIGAYFSLGERGKRDEGSTQMIKLQNKILEKWVN